MEVTKRCLVRALKKVGECARVALFDADMTSAEIEEVKIGLAYLETERKRLAVEIIANDLTRHAEH